ncbi:flagellar hook-length control protein FliK [Mesobacillus subterraneus]|uniref:Flagellar hook-length control protein FliK n=1 Tax=Mesobacillus subterraneus TaxID=285983 RepID=A0A3R9KX24_9BACI|nr:flagellar hook-length control protein FliK [Mesobacillus subterraneus]RSD28021.1 flagellar hook-length control protein FliK [Mesobacillus subterraneus]
MEIGSLGFFNAAAMGKQAAPTKEGNSFGFAGMMAALMSGNKETSSVGIGNNGALPENISELMEFLNLADLLEMEDGLKLIDAAVSNPEEVLSSALEALGGRKEDLLLFLQKWAGSNETGKPNTDDELIASLAASLHEIARLQQNDPFLKLGKDDIQSVKVLKLYEMLTRYADGQEAKNLVSLKESLSHLTEALRTQMKNNIQTEALQNRFTQVAKELNIFSAKKVILSETASSVDSGSSLKAEGPAGTVSFLPHMTKGEQLTLMMNNPEKPVSVEQLMKQFESILAKSQFMNSGGTQKLFIKLFPEHLGSIRVELFQKDQTMMARIITSTGTAKDTLESQINGLKQAFAAQNISVDRIEVTQQGTQQERFLNRDSQQQQRQPEQEQERKEEKGDFTVTFEEALLNTEA